ncbi:MAG: DegV family protein [Dehalococcoidales bacterium]|jgi:DegV family protein with EDD domain|nr:DegV family protein [Dehalococcoidales bacterium]MDD5604317.1 DegV family protein [Dehalococcoidales bacterium]MDX9985915.1 DegV family protein [Dehalococcoidales bacterium]NLE89779.1 DegV family protein [Dehalococcoidales bacterium]
MSIKVVTDSTADLPEELIREYGIEVVPAYVLLNGKTYRDGIDISQDELYRRMVDMQETVTTSQPPPADFAEVYRSLLKEVDHIISIQVTGRLSGIYASALSAKNMLEEGSRVHVVDSQLTSMGMGMLTVLAAQMARAGNTIEKIVNEIKAAINNTHIWATFDTLKYLHRGGRIGKAKALVGSMLNIKPLLTMRDGEIFPIGVARTRNRAIDRLIELANSITNIQDMAIVHSTSPDEAQSMKYRLGNISLPRPISISKLGPALGVHGGPGTLVVAVRKKAEEISQRTISELAEKRLFTLPSLPEIKLPKLRFVSQ